MFQIPPFGFIINIVKFVSSSSIALDTIILNSFPKEFRQEIDYIVINDGSKDDSLKIIKKYASEDKRIVIIDKKNSGYGDSMNQGLKKAIGEYVGIVESDDFIDTDAFEKLYNIAKKNDLDVVKANFYEYYGEDKKDKATSNMFLPEDTGMVIPSNRLQKKTMSVKMDLNV